MPRAGRIRKRASRAGQIAKPSDCSALARLKARCALRGIDEPMRHAEKRVDQGDGKIQIREHRFIRPDTAVHGVRTTSLESGMSGESYEWGPKDQANGGIR